MCLYTTEQKPKIAKEDIVVYKAMKKFLFLISPFYPSIWILNKIKRRKMKSLPIAYSTCNTLYYEISNGLHAYLFYKTARNYLACYIYEAIIPKGSEYYISYDGETIVSNMMKIVRKIK